MPALVRALFEQGPDPMLGVDRHGQVHVANRAALRLLGSAEAKGEQLRALLGASGQRLERLAREVIDEGASAEVSLSVPDEDGLRHVRVRAVRVDGAEPVCALTLTKTSGPAFVTLTERGALRGCIGTIRPVEDQPAEEGTGVSGWAT